MANESMLFKVLKRTIERGKNLEDMQEKLDIFLAAGKLTIEEYEILVAMLHGEDEEDETVEEPSDEPVEEPSNEPVEEPAE